MSARPGTPRLSRHLAVLGFLGLTYPGAWVSGAPILGLAYQPYVGQWSQLPDNPYAANRFYIPAFNTYAGGIDLEDPARSLLRAHQRIDLRFDREGRLASVDASGALNVQPQALRDAGADRWSRTYFRYFKDGVAQPATRIDHQASVYRQLDFLRRMAAGAPLTLTTYGTGFQAGYWRTIAGRDYVTLPVWTESQVNHVHTEDGSANTTRDIDQMYFYFPPTAVYVKPAPRGIRIETRGQPGRDLSLVAVHQTLFEPARKSDPDAHLNPGFFTADANGQIALAAAEINAQAGKPLLRIKLGVDNLAVDGSLVNDRMRFAILSALAQARLANRRFPGTVTHLVISNEYAQIPATADAPSSPTEQITAMVEYARAQIGRDGDFSELDGLRIGARGNRFREVDASAADPSRRRFSQDVGALVAACDFLMENFYPSPEAVEAARREGHWGVYFEPDRGELANQWHQLRKAIDSVAADKPIELMIGEIGHPTNGIAFNLPGYVEGQTAIRPDSAFARVANALETSGSTLAREGIEVFQDYFNEHLTSAFVREAVAWSRATGVQIHLFEAFDEPHKAARDTPLPGLTLAQSSLNRSGPYGAEAFYGLFGYSGVADFQVAQPERSAWAPGSRLTTRLPAGSRWAGPFEGNLYPKLPELDFARLARAFEPVISP